MTSEKLYLSRNISKTKNNFFVNPQRKSISLLKSSKLIIKIKHSFSRGHYCQKCYVKISYQKLIRTDGLSIQERQISHSGNLSWIEGNKIEVVALRYYPKNMFYKTPFKKIYRLLACKFIKKRLRHKCHPVKGIGLSYID